MMRLASDVKRSGTDGFEKEQFLETVRKNYLSLPSLLKENIKIVSGAGTPDEVYARVKEEVFSFLKI